MLRHGPVAASECSLVLADGSAACRPSRSSARSCVRSTRRAVAVSSCRTRPAPVAGSRTPPAARHAGLASRAALLASSPECRCAHRNSSSAGPPHYCGSPYPSPVLRSPANGPSVYPEAATRPRAGSVPPPAHRPRTRFHPTWSYRPGRRPAASPPQWRPCPCLPHAPPCAPSGSAHPSSSLSARPRPPDSSIPCSRFASCASGPTAPGPRGSACRSRTPSPIPARTRRRSAQYRAAQSTASPHSLPTWSRRCPSAVPSAIPVRPTIPAPTRTPLDAYRCRSSAGSARSSSDPGFARSVQSPETVVAPANRPAATRSHARYRCPRNIRSVAPESKSQVAAMAAPVARDRNAHTILPPTHRTPHPPVTHSTAYRKDARAPPPTPYARSRCLLASPRHSSCSSPCAYSTNYPCGSHPVLFHVSRLAPRAANSNEAKILVRNYKKIVERVNMNRTNLKRTKGTNMPTRHTVKDCTHIKVTGVRCGSPSLRGEQFCYFLQRTPPT